MSDDRGKPVLNLRKAAQGTLALLFEHTEGAWPAEGPCGKAHVTDMLHSIEDGTIAGEKAHRWLGWAQCAIVASGGGALDDMKAISVAALETDGATGTDGQ